MVGVCFGGSGLERGIVIGRLGFAAVEAGVADPPALLADELLWILILILRGAVAMGPLGPERAVLSMVGVGSGSGTGAAFGGCQLNLGAILVRTLSVSEKRRRPCFN